MPPSPNLIQRTIPSSCKRAAFIVPLRVQDSPHNRIHRGPPSGTGRDNAVTMLLVSSPCPGHDPIG
eukprot:scaffold1118_cov135-Cylindrotheca_fusiformis.AAC.6